MKEDRKTVELYYERAGNGKRLSSLLFDTFCSFFLGFVLLTLVLFLLEKSPVVESRFAIRDTLALQSGLYVEGESKPVRYRDEVLEEETLSVDEKSQLLDDRLEAFYAMPSFFPERNGSEIYFEYKEKAALENGEKLFEEGRRRLVNDDYDQTYLDFYSESFDIALGYLFQNSQYSSASRELILIYTFSIVGNFLFPIPIFFLIVPLCFSRTRQTFGMRLTRIALISADGLSVRTGKLVGRFFFLFFVEVVLSLVAFLIPFAVSIGMMALSKSHQSLHDYVFNTYVIVLDKNTIFKDVAEYRLSLKKDEGLTLEDEKYRPVSGVDQDPQL